MGRKPCCAKEGLQRGAWTEEEDCILRNYINHHGEGKWRDLPQRAGLKRCGKSCRLRWLNYLRPNIKRGNFSADEEELIIRLHKLLGNRWSLIAGRLPGRTDNEIKNYWNTKLSKRAFQPPQKTDHQDQFNKKLTAEKGGLKDRAVAKEDTTEPLKQVIRTKAVRCTKAVVSVAQQLENLEPAKPDISKAKENPFSLAVGDQDNDKGINFLKDLDNDEFVLIPDVNVGSSCSEIRTKAVRCTKAIVPAALELENLPSKSDMSKVEEKSLSMFSSTVGYQDKDEYINFLMDVDINELLVQDLNLGSCPDIGTKAMRCTEGIFSAALQLEPSKSETSRAEQSPYSLAVEDHDNEKCIHFLKDLDIDKVFTPDVNVSSSCGDIQTKVARCTDAIVPATLELQNLSPSKSDMNSRTQQSPFHLAVADWEKDGCIDFLMDFNINEFLTTDVN